MMTTLHRFLLGAFPVGAHHLRWSRICRFLRRLAAVQHVVWPGLYISKRLAVVVTLAVRYRVRELLRPAGAGKRFVAQSNGRIKAI